MRLPMPKTITVELDRELWDLFRPFYQHPQEAMKEVAVLCYDSDGIGISPQTDYTIRERRRT